MLTVQRNESKIEIKVDVDVPAAGIWTYTFTHVASNVPEAGFVVGAIQKQIGEHLQKERTTWYQKGWGDKSRHAVKQSWFPRSWVWLGS